MSTRLSAGVGDHPCFLTFYTILTVKLVIFPYTCFFAFSITSTCIPLQKKDHYNFSWCAQLLISGNLFASTVCISGVGSMGATGAGAPLKISQHFPKLIIT